MSQNISSFIDRNPSLIGMENLGKARINRHTQHLLRSRKYSDNTCIVHATRANFIIFIILIVMKLYYIVNSDATEKIYRKHRWWTFKKKNHILRQRSKNGKQECRRKEWVFALDARISIALVHQACYPVVISWIKNNKLPWRHHKSFYLYHLISL